MKSRRPLILALCLFAALTSVTLQCRRSEAVQKDPSEEEAERLFTRYLQIDTSNPPGNETAAAKFLQEVLTGAGLQARLIGHDPARMSVYARLSSGTTAPALLLLHHLDVVPADARSWSIPPFSGKQSGGYIWGRGALDIKSLGIAQLAAVLELKRSGRKLSRDVIFVGVADEEAGGQMGAAALLEKHPELFTGVGYVLTEGGANETIVDKVAYWGIETEQKLPLWIRVTTRGRPSHSAVPPENGGSAAELIRILGQLQGRPREQRLTPGVERMFAALSKTKKGEKGEVLREVRRHLGTAKMNALSPGYRALLRNTQAITTLQAGTTANAMPATSSATLDIRLLPDEQPEKELQEIRALVGKAGDVEVLLQASPAPASPTDSPLFKTLERAMTRAEPDSVVGPMVGAGTSDARFFRARGITAYGISPFKVNYYDADTVHGRDERIRTIFFHEGVRLMKDVVRTFCTTPG